MFANIPKWQRPVWDIYFGVVRFKYPLCCVLHFAYDRARCYWFGSKINPPVERGLIDAGPSRYYPSPKRQRYVPCSYHSRNHPNWQPFRAKSKVAVPVVDK